MTHANKRWKLANKNLKPPNQSKVHSVVKVNNHAYEKNEKIKNIIRENFDFMEHFRDKIIKREPAGEPDVVE